MMAMGWLLRDDDEILIKILLSLLLLLLLCVGSLPLFENNPTNPKNKVLVK